MLRMKQFTFYRVLKKCGHLLPQMFSQWRIFIAYAGIITILSALFGRWSYACRHNNAGYWCITPPDNKYMIIAWMAVYYLAVFYLVGSFVFDLFNSMFKNSVFKWRNVISFNFKRIKTTMVIWGVIALMIICLALGIYIIRQPANPDFYKEFINFLITFFLLLIPIFMIRCSAGFAYYLNTGSFQARKVYDITSGRTYISIMIFLLLMYLLIIINVRAISYFDAAINYYNSLPVALITDFADTLLKLVCFAVLLMCFQAQYIQIEEQLAEIPAQNNYPANENTEPDNFDTAAVKKTAKAANKKKNKRKKQNNTTETRKKKS